MRKCLSQFPGDYYSLVIFLIIITLSLNLKKFNQEYLNFEIREKIIFPNLFQSQNYKLNYFNDKINYDHFYRFYLKDNFHMFFELDGSTYEFYISSTSSCSSIRETFRLKLAGLLSIRENIFFWVLALFVKFIIENKYGNIP